MITQIRHPAYQKSIPNWCLWRDAWDAGDAFIAKYLKQFSKNETIDDFERRKALSYCPSFAKAGVKKVKNAIFQRLVDVTRESEIESYTRAVRGELGGVDNNGSSMNAFMGRYVLPEMLVMQQVGVYLDMPQLVAPTILAKGDKHPYLYTYHVEDILAWNAILCDNNIEFTNLLLRDWVIEDDEETGLSCSLTERYRHLKVIDGKVQVRFYKERVDNGVTTADLLEEYILNIPKIPFHMPGLDCSLMEDIARYQIAHLNLASADVSYAIRGNFPIYIEEYDPRTELVDIRGPLVDATGKSDEAKVSSKKEVVLGAGSGRRYPKGTNPPGFINPSSETLKVSMEKQDKIKAEILELINIAVSNVQPVHASAESKNYDERSLENGLSYIGLELEHAERRIATFWAMYEGSKKVPTVKYPESYSLKTDSDRNIEAKALQEVLDVVPSISYKKAICKKIAKLTVGNQISNDELVEMNAEIDKATVVNTDAKSIGMDVENGLVDVETASNIRGYPKGSAEKAKKDHAERLAEIAKHQGVPNGSGDPAARGIKDASADPKAGSTEKKGKPKRGDGK